MCRTGWGGAGVTARSIRSFPGRSWNGQHTSSTQYERYVMRTLTLNEVEQASGGIRMSEILDGAGLFLGGTLAIALAPEEAIGALAIGAYWGLSAVSGGMIGEGLISNP